ncbi:Cobalamin biosynthesis protein BluB [Marinobacterium lacunae]|uniref:Cobalamin biosynthesis protein BluB n=1 Tax=Marinobacterium lacunae TaxID=1232683 RepID=A0A081G2X4_9GAMM|nr:5,6-dimethylbenzimidazole synthase [Marinobacterium lacunae]KEA65129.1 Cobalamin biosynthesis protein BluB [Marinobacterium lacunae]MBR9884848.1 5,6-dimethylbenzimidazole synthase [Oceanospirillales bacterium]
MSQAFSAVEREAVYRAIRERRDMRHFSGEALEAGVLERLLQAAHQAPSVGLMQPWRFIRITDSDLRGEIRTLVDQERQATAKALGEREAEFLRLKVEGLDRCAELLVVSLMDQRERHIFGRRTLPEMDLASVACAIQNLWLAARAEGVGVGWVSLFDPDALADLLAMPSGSRAVAILCIGPVDRFYDQPMLEQEGWTKAAPLSVMLAENRWPAGEVLP